MRRYPAHFVNQARRLASENITYVEISKRLNIPRAIISTWCNDLSIGSHKSTIFTHQKRRRLLLNSGSEVAESIKIDKNNARLFCGILYGCEGSKYPATSGVALTNADPDLIVCFLRLFRRSFQVKEEKFRIHLQIHNDQDYIQLENYWSKLLKIPKSQFYKPTITIPRGRKHRNKYLGTCTIKYFDYRFQLKLIGVFEAFMRKLALQGGVA